MGGILIDSESEGLADALAAYIASVRKIPEILRLAGNLGASWRKARFRSENDGFPRSYYRNSGQDRALVGSAVRGSKLLQSAQQDQRRFPLRRARVVRSELTGFETRAIAQDHFSVERQSQFLTVPVNEFVDSVTIAPLCVR
jgi:hypothetical protein